MALVTLSQKPPAMEVIPSEAPVISEQGTSYLLHALLRYLTCQIVKVVFLLHKYSGWFVRQQQTARTGFWEISPKAGNFLF